MASELAKAYVQIIPTSQGLGNKLSEMIGGEAESAGKSGGISIGKGIAAGIGVASAAIGGASAAVGKFASEAVSSYANYEQLVGGIDKLYGDASGKLQKFADEAYKTSGMSANQYMETATSFSASLINSLGGDVDAAANMADVAMRSMSDNVNTFGTDMATVQHAFQGFARGQFTMLDSLSLGYGGTKEGMEQLLRDAEKYEGFIEGSLSIDNFADIVTAIEIVQDHLNIAGTTNNEAMTTIEGSAKATKAAWENVITAIGRGEGLKEAFEGLTTSIFGEEEGKGLLNQIIPRIQTTMEGIGEFIGTAGPMISEKIPEIINSILPSLLNAGSDLILAIIGGINNTVPSLIPVAVDAITKFTQALLQEIPVILKVGIRLFEGLVKGVSEALPQLMQVMTTTVLRMVNILVSDVTELIDAGLTLMQGFLQGIMESIPIILDSLPEMLEGFVDEILYAVPVFIDGTIQLIQSIAEALPEIIQELVRALPLMIDVLIKGLIEYLPLIINGWIQIAMAIAEALPTIIQAIVEAIPQIVTSLVSVLVENGPQFLAAVGNILRDILSRVLEFGSNILSNVGQHLSNLLQSVGEWLSQLPTKMAYWAGYAIASFVKFFIDLPGNLKTLLTNAAAKIQEFGANLKAKATEIARNFFNNLINGITSLPGRLAQLGRDLVNAIINLPSTFKEIGSNIVNGIWNGIKAGWDWLISSVKNLVDSLVQGAKDALGIASPSKVFEQIGEYTTEGFDKGMENFGVGAMKDVQNAMDELTNVSATVDAIGTSANVNADANLAAPSRSADMNAIESLLQRYLPMLENGTNVNVSLQGDAQGLFRTVRKEVNQFTKSTGNSPFIAPA